MSSEKTSKVVDFNFISVLPDDPKWRTTIENILQNPAAPLSDFHRQRRIFFINMRSTLNHEYPSDFRFRPIVTTKVEKVEQNFFLYEHQSLINMYKNDLYKSFQNGDVHSVSHFLQLIPTAVSFEVFVVFAFKKHLLKIDMKWLHALRGLFCYLNIFNFGKILRYCVDLTTFKNAILYFLTRSDNPIEIKDCLDSILARMATFTESPITDYQTNLPIDEVMPFLFENHDLFFVNSIPFYSGILQSFLIVKNENVSEQIRYWISYIIKKSPTNLIYTTSTFNFLLQITDNNSNLAHCLNLHIPELSNFCFIFIHHSKLCNFPNADQYEALYHQWDLEH